MMHWMVKGLAVGASAMSCGLTLANDPQPCPEKTCHTRGALWHEPWRPAPCPPPTGYSVQQYTALQIGKAELQERHVLLNEWYKGGTTLGPAGRRHLDKMARGLLNGWPQVFIEPGEDPAQDAQRLQALVDQLKLFGVKDAQERVVLSYPLGEGLYGDQAVWIYPRLIRPRGFGGGMGGGMGGMGGGMGGMGGGGFGGMGGGFGGGLLLGGIRGY